MNRNSPSRARVKRKYSTYSTATYEGPVRLVTHRIEALLFRGRYYIVEKRRDVPRGRRQILLTSSSPLGPPHSPYDGILVESALNFSQFVVQRIKNPNSNVGRTDADVDSVRLSRSVQSFQEKSLM